MSRVLATPEGHKDAGAAVRPGDLVLCRNNAPLIRVCLALIQQGTPAVVRGNDLSKTLVKDAAQAFKGGLAGWPAKLARFEQRELARLEAALPGEVVEAAVARRMDDLACLEALTRHAVASGVGEQRGARHAHQAALRRPQAHRHALVGA